MWTPNQRDIDRTNAFGQQCLQSICDIHLSEQKTNEYIFKCTNQVPISCRIKKRRLKLFGHVARFPDGADTADALIPRLSKHWKRPRGRPQNSWSGTVEKDLKPHNIGLHPARSNKTGRGQRKVVQICSWCHAPTVWACNWWWWWPNIYLPNRPSNQPTNHLSIRFTVQPLVRF